MHERIISVLTDLSQLDIDAVEAYTQALKKIDDVEVYNNLQNFKNDHLRHIDELNAMIQVYGGQPPENKQDLKGYLIEGLTYLRSMTGTNGALNAMEGNEKITNKHYRQALESNPDFPPDVKELLTKNYDDEKHHLSYIIDALKKINA